MHYVMITKITSRAFIMMTNWLKTPSKSNRCEFTHHSVSFDIFKKWSNNEAYNFELLISKININKATQKILWVMILLWLCTCQNKLSVG